jgi:hypothetical protein
MGNTTMFCPKCRNKKTLNQEIKSSWNLFKKSNSSHCNECGTLLCADRLASEFDLNEYTPDAHVYQHRLDGLITVSKVLIETRSEPMSDLSQRRALFYDQPTTTFSTIASNGRSYHSPENQLSERIGRYDSLPVEELVEKPESSKPLLSNSKSPSPWPIIAIVIVLELFVTVGFFSSARRPQPMNHVKAGTVSAVQASPSNISNNIALAPNGTPYQEVQQYHPFGSAYPIGAAHQMTARRISH